MLDDMFHFIDPIVESSENDIANMVIQTELFFNFLQKSGIKRKIELPEENSTTLPLEIALSLLRPNEVEKLKRYLASYKDDPDH